MPGLDELFEDTGVTQEEPAQELEEKDVPETSEEEKPEEPPKEPEKPSEPPSEEKPSEAEAYKAAMQDERRKRQEYERRLREYEEREKEEKPKQNFWDDPEGVVNQRLESLKNELHTQNTTRFLRLSENLARKRYDDYDSRITAFNEVIQANPALYQQMLESDDPAEFAYQTGKTYEFTKDAPTIEDLEKKIEAKVEARLREKLEKEYADRGRDKLSNVPESLTDETGKTTRAKVDPNVSPLDEVFPD